MEIGELKTYEEFLEQVDRLEMPERPQDRVISWATAAAILGLARTPDGRIEIFIVGDELEASRRRVQRAVEYQEWFRLDGSSLLSNRLLLPAAGHFQQVAAFLCAELSRAGVETDQRSAFAATEALIELSLESLLLTDEALLGLCGELIVLSGLLSHVEDASVVGLLESWKGYVDRAARDFQLANHGLEVKTTTSGVSSHIFSGVHQLEAGHGADGAEEAYLWLISVGLEWVTGVTTSTDWSLPKLVDSILHRIESVLPGTIAPARKEFLSHIASYGSRANLGYEHDEMGSASRFQRPFRIAFVRAYDLSDPAIRLLTSADLQARPFIDARDLRIRVNFPDKVTGDVNPISGLSDCAAAIVASAT